MRSLNILHYGTYPRSPLGPAISAPRSSLTRRTTQRSRIPRRLELIDRQQKAARRRSRLHEDWTELTKTGYLPFSFSTFTFILKIKSIIVCQLIII